MCFWEKISLGLQSYCCRSEEHISRDKETEDVSTYALLGRTCQQVDDFIAAAYDSYRAMLKGEQKEKAADR